MDKSKVNWKVDMFDRVVDLCDANAGTLESVPALETSYNAFKAKCTDVKARMGPLSIEDNGLAEAKNKTWDKLAKQLDSITAAISAYASVTDNIALQAQARFSPSEFLKARITDATSTAKELLTLANTHIGELASYNMTTDKVKTAETLLSELVAMAPKPTTSRSTNKALRSALFDLVAETNSLLKSQMDKLVRTLAADHPDFVAEYFAARRLVRTGIRHRQPEPPADKQAMDVLLNTSIESIGTQPKAVAPAPVAENGVAA